MTRTRYILGVPEGLAMHIAYSAEHERLRQRAAGLLRRPDDAGAARRAAAATASTATARPTRTSSGRWAATAGSPSAGPSEYGGRGGSALDQLIFTDEAAAAGAPVPFLTINTVGPTIMRFGTAEQKAFFLPRIASGELHFSIGYSEPGAGTDLASLRTRAVPRRGRVRHQRPEDVDEPDPVRRLRLARLPHRPGRAQAPAGCPCSSSRPTPRASPGRRSARCPA